MSQDEIKVELGKRYCPSCKFDTQHAVLVQLRTGYPRPEELSSACGVCNADGFWGLRIAHAEPVSEPAVVRSA